MEASGAVEIYLKFLKSRFLTVAFHIGGDLIGGALPGGTVAAGAGAASNVAEVDAEAHASARRFLIHLGRQVVQIGPVAYQVCQRRRRWLPDVCVSGGAAQGEFARAANPDGRMGLLHGLGVDVHIVKREETSVEGGGARFPASFPEAQVLVCAGAALSVGDSQGVVFLLIPAGADSGDGTSAGHLVEGGKHLGGHDGVAVGHYQHGGSQLYGGSPRRDVGQRHQGVVDVPPRLVAGGVVNDDVVVDEEGIETKFFGLARRLDDGLGGSREAEVVCVGEPEGILGHIASACQCWTVAMIWLTTI